MRFVDRGKEGIRKVLTECLALVFLLADRRVRWHAKIAVLLPLGYIASPIDLIPDGLLFFGQIDDLIIIRAAYSLLKRIVEPAVLEDNRARAAAYLTPRKGSRMRFAIAFSAVWIFLFTFLALYLLRKFRRRLPH
jgi:uncharacterized membrane protein YkvA (DUF1232 family)